MISSLRYKITAISLLPILILILTGCITGMDQRARKQDQAKTEGPTINLPPPQTVSTEKLERSFGEKTEKMEKRIGERIIASSNTTQSQLSGLLNASVSKLGEKVTGLDAHLSDLIKVNATMNNTAQAELKARLDATLTASAEVKAEMKNLVNVSNKMDAKLSAVVTMSTKLDAVAAGQVGFNNKLDSKIEDVKQTFLSRAGRDVNMLPKQAVDIITGSYENFAIVLGLVLAAATTVISLSYKYSRQRAERRGELEREDRQFYHELLLSALVYLPPEKAAEINHQMEQKNGASGN